MRDTSSPRLARRGSGSRGDDASISLMSDCYARVSNARPRPAMSARIYLSPFKWEHGGLDDVLKNFSLLMNAFRDSVESNMYLCIFVQLDSLTFASKTVINTQRIIF